MEEKYIDTKELERLEQALTILDWKTAQTSSSNRVNLFRTVSEKHRHLATLSSGSKKHLAGFLACIELIEGLPRAYQLSIKMLRVLRQHNFIQSGEFRQIEVEILTTLGRVKQALDEASK